MRTFLLSAFCLVLSAFAAFAFEPGPQLVADYDRDGKISPADRDRALSGDEFTIWINDDDDADGDGDTNSDLHDVPGGKDGEGDHHNKDCADDNVNGRCDLLDFFPVLVNVREVPDWEHLTWKLCSDSVNVVFTGLKTDNAGSFHTQEVEALEGVASLCEAPVEKLTEDGVAFPSGFLDEAGEGVFVIEGRKQGLRCLTLRGYKYDEVVAEVTMNLGVKPVEEMYGWINLRPGAQTVERRGGGGQRNDNRHFVFVHGYNTNHEEARGNAAEFYKKLWQSGSDAMFTAVEWRGDRSQVKFELLGINFSPNYFVNVENAFEAARPFAEACKKLPGEKILVGHSLGNVLISSAIKDYGLDYTKYVMLNAAVAREAYDASAYDQGMVPEGWRGGEGGDDLTNHLDRASRWYRNFADCMYDPYEYRRKLAWRGRFANLPRTVNYYSQSDDLLLNPDPNEKDPDKILDRNDPDRFWKVNELLLLKLVNGRSIGRDGSKKTGFGFWSFSEKMKGTWLLDVVNDVLTNVLKVAQADAYKCEGGWGFNPFYDDEVAVFDPANTRFTPFLDERMTEWGMLDILPAETERLRAQHLADAIPAESFAAGANPVATLENVNLESFIGENPDWPLFEGEEVHTNVWNHSAFREVAFYHTSKFYASLAAVGKPRVIIDTDLGSSVDDLFTIDLAARMHQAGKLDLTAVMMNRPDKSDPDGKGEFLKFADRYLATLGFADLPLGKSMPLAEDCLPRQVFNPYWTLIYSNDVSGVSALMPTNRTDAELGELADAVSLYRRLLDDAPEKSVVICSIGFLNNLKALMESGINYEGDGIASTGLELVAAKVKELRIMGGCFDGSVERDFGVKGEYNVMGDVQSAKKIFSEWPTPIVVTPWEVGTKLEYKPEDVLKDFPVGTLSPTVRAAYERWPNPPEGFINRLWDPMTIFPLTEGEMFAPLSEQGGIEVDDEGATTFTPNASSNRCYQIASNMNATAVMSRLREICRTGNPSVTMLVSGKPEPGVDYNGSELVFKFENIQLGSYAEEDLKFGFAVGGAEYAPESFEWDERLGVLSVRFVIPPDAVTAGNVYDGTLTVALENDELGSVQLTTASRQLVQGDVVTDCESDWFFEFLEAPTNYVPATAMPEKVTARVKTTVSFTGEPFEEHYLSPAGAVQTAVRIVVNEGGGYMFQFYAFVADKEEDFDDGWWDCNISNVVPVVGKSYEITAELMYPVDAEQQLYTVAFSVKDAYDNRPAVPVFLGNMIDDNGGIGNAGRLGSVAFVESGEDIMLEGATLVNTIDANLARIDYYDEYATVADAVAAAEGKPIRLLHAASWRPSEADFGKPVRFLNKSWLNLDVPSDVHAVWSEVVGNNGTLTLSKVDPVGVCSWSWHEPMTNILARMAANGFKGIQLALSPWVWEGEGSAAQQETFGGQEGEEVFSLISNKCAKGELDIHATMICFSNEDYTAEHTISNTCGFYYGLAPSATAEQKALADLTWAIRSNQFAKAVERTRMLGVRNITAHIGLAHLDDENMSRLYWACRTCQENGCMLLVETGMYSAKEEVAMLERFMERHPDAEIGLNFDMANQVLYGVDNPTNAYAVMKDWIGQVHVKDCVETYSARGGWATDVEWGRGDVSRTYDMIGVLKADGFEGPMLVEHESGSSDPDVREREIITAVKAIRGEPALVAAGLGEVLGPYLTAAAATNAALGAEFTPSAEVAERLGGAGSTVLQTYCNMFTFDVVPTSGGKWAVAAFLKPQDWTNVVESAQAATRQIPVAELAAQEYGTPLENVPLTNCVPGFYYSLYDGSAVTNVSVDLNEDNRDILCGPGKTVTIPLLPQPSPASGFFAIGVLEIPMVYVPGEDHVITGLHFEIPKPRRR